MRKPGRKIGGGQLTTLDVVERTLKEDFSNTDFIMRTVCERIIMQYPSRSLTVQRVTRLAMATKLIEKTGRTDQNGTGIWRMKQ